MHTTATALRIAVLGSAGPAFAQDLHAALLALLPNPSRTLQWLHTPHASADLHWLMAWEDEVDTPAEDAMQALARHQQLRRDLHAQGLSYQVLRGPQPQQLSQALSSLRPWLPELGPFLPDTGVASRRPGWSCSECSDPDCEHRSFTALLADRKGAAGAY